MPANAFNGFTDYGYLQEPGSIQWNAPQGVSLDQISNANGVSVTAFVTHLGCNPHDYLTGPTPWYNCLQAFAATSVDDSDLGIGQDATSFSSPHPGGNLVLFADGHVQLLNANEIPCNTEECWWSINLHYHQTQPP